MMIDKRRVGSFFLIALGLSLAWPGMVAWAEEWKPQKAIRLVTTDAPGTFYDVQARIISAEMSKIFNQPVMVDNETGGGMMKGTMTIYRARPDGYTIGITSSTALIINQLFHEAQYDLSKFTFLGQSLNTTLVPSPFITTAGKGLDTLEEIPKLSRPFRFATPGKGTPSYIVSKAVGYALKFKDPVFVTSYTGSEVIPAVVRGECDGANLPMFMVEPFIKDGSLKMVLVIGKKRFETYPNVPCSTEIGHPELERVSSTYHIVIAPPDLPKNIYMVLNDAVYKAVASEPMKDYHNKALSKGAMYDPAQGDITRSNVLGCLDAMKAMAPFLK